MYKNKKKLFEIKNPAVFKKENQFNNIINSYFIKPFKIILLCLKVKEFFEIVKKIFNHRGASWIGFHFYSF